MIDDVSFVSGSTAVKREGVMLNNKYVNTINIGVFNLTVPNVLSGLIPWSIVFLCCLIRIKITEYDIRAYTENVPLKIGA